MVHTVKPLDFRHPANPAQTSAEPLACILGMLPIHFSPARPCKWQGRAARHCFWFVSCVSACIEIQQVHVRRASYRSNFVTKGLHARCLLLKLPGPCQRHVGRHIANKPWPLQNL